jgi:GNAT superfamily N-acetyltransferase
MLDKIRIRFNQFLEEARQKSLPEALQKAMLCYLQTDRVVVPCYSDLSTLKEASKGGDAAALEFLVVDGTNAEAAAARNSLPSRKLKDIYNTRQGYYAYAVVSDGEIVGDIWCASPRAVRTQPLHPDLEWLGITCGPGDAYMFDMYVKPDSRGKEITKFLLSHALEHLKECGFSRAYGFYEKDNLPALWTHRLFGYIELQKRKISRVLFYTKSEPVPASSSGSGS